MTLDILTAAAIAPVQHGFFTRKGGVSSGIYQGLNCGFGSADSAQNVRHNRDLVAKSFGIDRTHLISVHQTRPKSLLCRARLPNRCKATRW